MDRRRFINPTTLILTSIIVGSLLPQLIAAAEPANAPKGSLSLTDSDKKALACRNVDPSKLKGGITNQADLDKLKIPKDANAKNDACLFLEKNKCGNGTISTGKAPACPNGTRPTRVAGMNPSFSQCIQKFIEAYNASGGGGNVCLKDGFRAPGEQNCARANSANQMVAQGISNHERGLAADLNPSDGNYARLHAFAQKNPQLGIYFRHGMADRPHVEPTTQGCGAGQGVTPPPNPGGQSPGSQISAAIRQALGQEQQPQPTASQQPAPQQQPQPQLPPQPTLPAQPTATAQPTSATQPAVSPISSQITPISDFINTNSNTNTNTNKASSTATSTFDLIDEYLNPISDSIDIGTAVYIDLNASTSDAVSLEGTQPTSTLVAGATGTLATNQSIVAPQTFTSGDLAKNYARPYVPAQNTFALRLLDTMKNTLLYALNYLKPFGGIR